MADDFGLTSAGLHSLLGQRLEAGRPHLDDRELGKDEESVQEYEQEGDGNRAPVRRASGSLVEKMVRPPTAEKAVSGRLKN